MKPRAFWILLTAASLSTPAVHAEEAADALASRSFDRGIALADARHFEEAALAFEQAYAQSPSFAVLRNVGRAWATARHFSAAIAAYSRYLSDGAEKIPKAVRSEVETELRALEAMTGTIAIVTEPSAATVLIDGRVVGTTPLAAARLDAGLHTLQLQSTGFRPTERELMVVAGTPLQLDYRLEPLPATKGVPVICPAPTPRSSPDLRAELSRARQSDSLYRARERRTWSYVAAGSGALLGVVAGVLAVYNQKSVTDWEREQRALDDVWSALPPNEAGPNARQAKNDARSDRIRTLDQVTTGVGVAGASLFALGVGLFLSSRVDAPRETAPTRSVASLSFRFR